MELAVWCLCSLALISAVAAAGDEASLDFHDFVLKYNRTYKKGTEEYERRRQIFKENVMRHAWLNERHGNGSHLGGSSGTTVYGINDFADLTDEEFARRYGMHVTPDGTHCRPSERQCSTKDDGTVLPDRWDWRDQRVVSAVKNQKECGSCWAFGIVETIETLWAIRHGKLYNLSAQQLLDCVPNCSCKGCSSNAALAWLVKNKVKLELDKTNPYVAKKKSCQNLPTTEVGISDYSCCGFLPQLEMSELRRVLYQNGPFAIMINAAALKDYVSGVIQHHCAAINMDISYHSVVIVGYDVSGDVPHWIVRNSWGPGFGEDGYFRLVMGKGMCGMDTIITYPDL